MAVHPNLAAGGEEDAREHPDGGGFARAVPPDLSCHLSRPDLKADAIYGLDDLVLPGMMPGRG